MRYEELTLAVIVTGTGAAVASALTTAGRPVDRECVLVPGEVAWDACDCGQLAQTITSVYPSSSFPTSAADSRQTACGPNITVATVTLSLARCVPSVPPGGAAGPPTCAQLLDAAVTLERDRWLVRRTVACHLRSLRTTNVIFDFAVGAAVTVGPTGGCVGLTLGYSIGVGGVCC